jgi:hypothetical protein
MELAISYLAGAVLGAMILGALAAHLELMLDIEWNVRALSDSVSRMIRAINKYTEG